MIARRYTNFGGPKSTFVPVTQRNTQLYGTGSSTTLSHNFETLYEFKEAEGWNTPRYHERLRKGEIIPFTPYREFSVRSEASGSRSLEYRSGTATQYTRVTYEPNVWVPDRLLYKPSVATLQSFMDTVDGGRLVQAAAAKIASQGFDALTFLAEFASTKRMFEGAARKLDKLTSDPRFVRDILRKLSDKRYDKQTADALTGAYLEARYGWRPLLADIRNLKEVLTNLDKFSYTRHKAGSSSKEQHVATTTILNVNSPTSGVETCTAIDNIEVSTRGIVYAEISVDPFSLSPLRTGWEIIPLSFVIDWFIHVGRSLAALEFLLAQTNYTACAGYKVTLYRMTESVFSTNATTRAMSGGGMGYCNAELIVRTPQRVSITPQTAVRLDAWKVLDLLALLKQRLQPSGATRTYRR